MQFVVLKVDMTHTYVIQNEEQPTGLVKRISKECVWKNLEQFIRYVYFGV